MDWSSSPAPAQLSAAAQSENAAEDGDTGDEEDAAEDEKDAGDDEEDAAGDDDADRVPEMTEKDVLEEEEQCLVLRLMYETAVPLTAEESEKLEPEENTIDDKALEGGEVSQLEGQYIVPASRYVLLTSFSVRSQLHFFRAERTHHSL